jgi:8-oxo-dGTP diphosphatase
MKMKSYVLGFMFNEAKNRVVLIQKKRPEWQKGKWNGVGGHIEPGESCEHAMVRTFREETGVTTGYGYWEEVCKISIYDRFCCHIFRAFVHDLHAVGLKSCTDETVMIQPINSKRLRISNLGWLMGMCLDENDGFKDKYTVFGKVGF